MPSIPPPNAGRQHNLADHQATTGRRCATRRRPRGRRAAWKLSQAAPAPFLICDAFLVFLALRFNLPLGRTTRDQVDAAWLSFQAARRGAEEADRA